MLWVFSMLRGEDLPSEYRPDIDNFAGYEHSSEQAHYDIL